MCRFFTIRSLRQELTADPVNGLNLVSTGLATTAFFLKKSKSIVMRAGLVDMVAENERVKC